MEQERKHTTRVHMHPNPRGLQPDWSFTQHSRELVRQRVTAWEINARKVARKMYANAQRQLTYGADRDLVLSDSVLRDWARMYGAKTELIPYAIGTFRQLVNNNGLKALPVGQPRVTEVSRRPI